MRHAFTKALAVGLLSLAVAGCGGDDGDENGGGQSKEDWIAQADAICKETDQKESDAGAPGPVPEIKTRVLAEIVEVDGEALVALQALEPPEDDKDEAAKVVSDVEAVQSAREAQLEAVQTDDTGGESDARNDFFTASSDLGASAGAYGLTYCQALGF